MRRKTEGLLSKIDDNMEIVVVSDTVRQRRSRTPISPSSFEGNNVNGSELSPAVMPDLLPKLSNGNDSDVSRNETHLRDKLAKVDTINVFESVSRFEPEQVETVHIVDVSSDSEASTPLMPRKEVKSSGSIDQLKNELKSELDSISTFKEEEENPKTLNVEKVRISFESRDKFHDDEGDILAESKPGVVKNSVKNLKIRRTLKELWMEERVNSFYSPENDNDEPIVFSDDEEIPRYSIEMDSDSDVVA